MVAESALRDDYSGAYADRRRRGDPSVRLRRETYSVLQKSSQGDQNKREDEAEYVSASKYHPEKWDRQTVADSSPKQKVMRSMRGRQMGS